jgi:hypothetical protein
MAQTPRRWMVTFFVLGFIVVVTGVLLLIGLLSGDDTDQIDPQNGDSAPTLVR